MTESGNSNSHTKYTGKFAHTCQGIFTYSHTHTHAQTHSLSKDCLNSVVQVSSFVLSPHQKPDFAGSLYGNVFVLKNRTAMEWNGMLVPLGLQRNHT